MCDFRWIALAEFLFYRNELPQDIYCLCSRVFTSNLVVNNTDSDTLTEETITDTNCTEYYINDSKDYQNQSLNLQETEPQPLQDNIIEDCTNNLAWQEYWSLNGERLIWESWITKYGAYVNPDYDQSTVENYSIRSSFEKPDSLKLSLDSLSPLQDSSDYSTTLGCSINNTAGIESEDQKTISNDIVEKNRILVRNLSGSDSYDKLSRECEGWNPLSPISNDCETEVERLITSRCGSRTGSSSVTIDSMTNVTHMTISSVDLSESSKSPHSFSSVSSVHSSLTSTSSEDVEDYQQQWNQIWTNHYEQEYTENYKKFLLHDAEINTIGGQESKSDQFNNENNTYKDVATKNVSEALKKNGRSVVFKDSNTETNVLSSILNLMNMDEDKVPDCNPASDNESKVVQIEEMYQMQDLGLPTSFSNRKAAYSKDGDCSKHVTTKTDQSLRNRIQAAFRLLGLKLLDNQEEKVVGSVSYKMRNISRQNDGLKMNSHIYFEEEDGLTPELGQVTVQNSHQDELLGISPNSSPEDDSVDAIQFDASVVQNRRKRKRKNRKLPKEIRENPKLRKYWHRRYSLFSKFDDGIQLDEESWFSVTPELIAKNTAERCQCDVVIDAFCGAGGNSIQLAFTCNKVIAIDIDANKIKCAQHNAQIYNVSDRIEFIVGDFFQIADQLKGDVVFLSPPWGGVEYLRQPIYDLNMLKPYPLNTLLGTAKKITDNICLFLPRNSNTHPLIMEAGSGGSVELEQNFLNKRLVALTAYYGSLIRKPRTDT